MNWTLEIIEIFVTPMKNDEMVLKIYSWLCLKIMITDGNASASFIIAVNGERSLLEITWLFIQPQFKN